MTTILSILILAIATICLGRRLRRKRSCTSTGNASSSLPILTDEEMEKMLEENDRIYEQLMAEGRALHAMFASQDGQRAKEAGQKVASTVPQRRRNRTSNSSEPRKRRKQTQPVAAIEPEQQQRPQLNVVQANPVQANPDQANPVQADAPHFHSSQQNTTVTAAQLTTLPLIQSRPPSATWYSRLVAPIHSATRRFCDLVKHTVLRYCLIGPWFIRPKPPANLPQEPTQRRAA